MHRIIDIVILRVFLLLISALHLGSCAPQTLGQAELPTPYTNFSEGCGPVLIFIRGLNSSSEVLEPFRKRFLDQNYCVCEITLSSSTSPRLPATSETWRKQVEDLLQTEELQNHDVHLIGYSAGSLAAILALGKGVGSSHVVSSVLLAPPLQFRTWVHLSRVLFSPFFLLKNTGFALPSFGPKRFRDAPFTNLKSYSALFSSSKEAVAILPQLAQHKVFLALSPSDEFIDYDGTISLLEKAFGQATSVYTVEKEESAPGPAHLFHPSSLGEAPWERLAMKIEEFLGRKQSP